MNTLVKLDFSNHISPPDVFRLQFCVKKQTNKETQLPHIRGQKVARSCSGGGVYIEKNIGSIKLMIE